MKERLERLRLQRTAAPRPSDRAGHAAARIAVAEDVDEQDVAVGTEAGACEFAVVQAIYRKRERRPVAGKSHQAIDIGNSRRQGIGIVLMPRRGISVIFAEQNAALRVLLLNSQAPIRTGNPPELKIIHSVFGVIACSMQESEVRSPRLAEKCLST